jgi:hypothetical protein
MSNSNVIQMISRLRDVVSMHSENNEQAHMYAQYLASAAKEMRTALFWAITQGVVVIPYRRFGTTYRSST